MRLFPSVSTFLYIGIFTALNLQFTLQRMLHGWYETSFDQINPLQSPLQAKQQYQVRDKGKLQDDMHSDATTQPQEHPTTPVFREQDFDPEKHMSACLIVMDDNHYLIEWIAYHYHVANLRHLIITSDPNSLTKPSKVLDRWRGMMIIEEWKSDEFLPEKFDHIVQKLASHGQRKKNLNLQNHRARQAIFNLQCLRTLQDRNRKWVSVTDTDEYITPNPVLKTPSSSDDGDNIAVPSDGEEGAIVKVLNSLAIPNKEFEKVTSPCVPMYRRQFTTKEMRPKTPSDAVLTEMDHANFQTLRWRKYGANKRYYEPEHFDTECKLHRRIPNKVVINVQEVNLWHKHNSGNPHMPISVCPSEVYMKEYETPLVVNHYLGTKEQWLYRSGDKRGAGYRTARYHDFNLKAGHFTAEDISGWLVNFVQNVGEETAARLLAGVGELEPLPGHENDDDNDDKPTDDGNTEESETEAFESYKPGQLVQANYKGDGYWYFAEVVDVLPGGYYNLVYEDCTQELATNSKLVRLDGKVSVR